MPRTAVIVATTLAISTLIAAERVTADTALHAELQKHEAALGAPTKNIGQLVARNRNKPKKGKGSAICGNGSLEAGEQCDDGNTINGDGCSDTCQIEAATCGNGFLEAGEQCEDGNTINGDGCSSTCQRE
jgi:cysteine-rich repeat protein